MNPEVEEIYAGVEREGAAQVRVNLASHVYGEVRERHANAWVGLKDREAADSQRTSEMSLAAEANALARAANDIAGRFSSSCSPSASLATEGVYMDGGQSAH